MGFSYTVTRADGSQVTRTNLPGGGFRVSPSSSSSSSSTSSSSSSRSSSKPDLVATATNIQTGETKYLVDGKLQDTRPRRSSSSSRRSTPPKSQVQAKATITNPETGESTTQEFDQRGQEVSRTSSRNFSRFEREKISDLVPGIEEKKATEFTEQEAKERLKQIKIRRELEKTRDFIKDRFSTTKKTTRVETDEKTGKSKLVLEEETKLTPLGQVGQTFIDETKKFQNQFDQSNPINIAVAPFAAAGATLTSELSRGFREVGDISQTKLTELQKKENPNLLQVTAGIGLTGVTAVAGVGQLTTTIADLPFRGEEISTAIGGTIAEKGLKGLGQDIQTGIADTADKARKGGVREFGELVGYVTGIDSVGLVAGGVKGVKTAGRAARVLKADLETPNVQTLDFFTPGGLQTGFQTARRTEDIVRDTQRADNIVISASPERLPTSGGSFTVGEGRRSKLGLEDPGLFVTAKGKGEPAFLFKGNQISEIDLAASRLAGNKFSLNPFASLTKQRFKIEDPTISQFQTKGVVRLPDDVKRQPGFEAVRKFQESLQGEQVTIPTKRGEIGKGELPAQTFKAPVDFSKKDTGGIIATTATGKKVTEVRKGDLLREMGTVEAEQVLPFGSEFVRTGTAGVVRVKGRKVIVEKFEPATSPELRISQRVETPEPPNTFSRLNRKKLEEDIAKGRPRSEALEDYFSRESSFIQRQSSVRTPFSEARSFSGMPSSSTPSSAGLFSSSSSGSPTPSSSTPSSARLFSSSSSGSPTPSSSTPSTGGSSGGSVPTSPRSSTGGGSSGGSDIRGGSRGSIPTPPVREETTLNKGKFKFSLSDSQETRKGYDVYIKEGSKYVKIAKNKPKNRAFALGYQVTDNTLAASFELRPSGKKTTTPDIFFVPAKQFQKSKRKETLRYVEPVSKRIDTLGEKRGLTVAKYMAEQKKSWRL